MKPRNFPTSRLRRQARAKLRQGMPLEEAEYRALQAPKDIRIRKPVRTRP